MSEQRIISAVKIRPFQPQIGQQAASASATAVGLAQQLVERFKHRFSQFWLRLENLPFHWRITPAPLQQTLLRQFMIDARQANYHDSGQSVTAVQQRLQPIVNQQTFNAFMAKHMQQVIRTAVSFTNLNLKQSFSRQNQTGLMLTTKQYWEQPVEMPMYLRQAPSVSQVERQLLIQRLFQQGRRIEQPRQQNQQRAASSSAAASPPFAGLPMSVAHSQAPRTAQQNRPIPVQDEVIRVENDRFPAQSSAAKAAAFNVDELDGMQLQRLTDQIVRRIDDRIQAQRERLGRF